MILSVMYNPKAPALWQATMQTKNGIEFVTGDREHRNVHDWRPKGWVFDELNSNWYSVADKAKLDAEMQVKGVEIGSRIAKDRMEMLRPQPKPTKSKG